MTPCLAARLPRLLAVLPLIGGALGFAAVANEAAVAPDALMLYLADYTVTPNPFARPDFAAMTAANLRARGETAAVTVNGQTASIQQIGTTREAISQLNKEASGQVHAGEYAHARDKLNEALAIAKNLADTEAQAAVLNNLGVVDAARGEFPSAIRNTQAAYTLYAALAEKRDQPAPVSPAAANFVEQMKQAFQQMKQQVQAQLAGASYKVERTLLNLGTLNAYLGQYEEAFKQYQMALALHPNADAPEGAGTVLRAMARAELRMGHADKAQAYAERAARAGQDSPSALIELDSIALGKIDAPAVPSPLRQAQAQAAAQTQISQRRLPDAQQLTRFEEQAFNAERSGELGAALAARRQSAAWAEATGSGDDLRASLAHLQRLHGRLQQPELAIYYGKRAVNEIQNQRSGLATMDRDVRKTFIAESRSVYESLAEGLIDQDRLPEAELALRLLRQGDSAELLATAGHMPFSQAEQALLAQEATLWATLRANRDARASLRPSSPLGALASASPMVGLINLTDSEYQQGRKRAVDQQETMLAGYETAWATKKQKSTYETALGVAMLRRQLETLRQAGSCPSAPPDPREALLLARAKALQEKMGEGDEVSKARLASEALSGTPFGSSRSLEAAARLPCLQEEATQIEAAIARADPAASAALRPGPPVFGADDTALLDARRLALAAQPAGSVNIHYLVGEQRLRILVSSARGRVARQVPISRAALEARIDNAGSAFRNERRNPLAAARELHTLLIAPIAADLEGAGARTLLLALDGKLRYLPFAALQDGQQWLIERYALALDTATAPVATNATVPVSAWRAAAFGNSVGSGDLRPLLSVPDELRAVVRGDGQGSGAAMPGIIRQDSAFTAQALRDAVAQHYALIHIASHFELSADDPRDSFLLLGDGKRLTLREMKQQNDRFDGVELLTLSACQTARDGQNGYGQEIEGLAAFMQNQGARSVVSTLWSVNDTSTGKLMQQLYLALQLQGVSKAQALQRAQLALIRGAKAPQTGDATERSAKRLSAEAALPVDSSRTYAHPYFWAPFILTGLWL